MELEIWNECGTGRRWEFGTGFSLRAGMGRRYSRKTLKPFKNEEFFNYEKTYIPCLDNLDATIKLLSSIQRGDKFERHCPNKDHALNCLVPPPTRYKIPILWPKSRDQVWEAGTQPPLCDQDDDPDKVWYVDLKACIARLPEDGSGSNVTSWPARLHNPPDRLQSIKIDAYISRKELFSAESKYWEEIIDGYVRVLHWKKFKLRNVMDMRAGFGGFAAALAENKFDCWVLNVVLVSGQNTLPTSFDRGLLGVMHDWCEPFDTYPRTNDFLHAAGLFSIEQKRCNISSIMLEMDRILRPGGRAYIRDNTAVVSELEEIRKAMGWHVTVRETSEGPHASYRILTADKRLIKS